MSTKTTDQDGGEVCYVCQGLLDEDCDVCGGDGFIGEEDEVEPDEEL